MDKRHFSFFESYYKSFKGLPPKVIGEIILAMGALYFENEEVELKGLSASVYELIKPVLESSKKKAENGVKGGSKPKAKGKQTESKTVANDKQTPSDKDKDKDKDKDNISPLLPFVDYEAIVNDYNNTCISYPKVTALSEARKKAIKARLKTVSIEDIHKAFEMAEQSDFLKGANNRNWSANFDWIMKDANLAKILDGNYTNKGKTQQDGFEWLSQQIREGAFHDEG